MINRIIVSLLSISLILAPIKHAHSFVPAAALVGYIATTGGTAYRIGQAGAAIGALALLLLSSDTQNTTRGRVGLKRGYEPKPRQLATNTSTIVYGAPSAYSEGCTKAQSWTLKSTGASGGVVTSTCMPCIQAWNEQVTWFNEPSSTQNKVFADARQCGQGGKTHRVGGVSTETTYSTDTLSGLTYEPAPNRTVIDKFADVKVDLRPETGKIEFMPYKDDPDFQTEVDGGSTHPVLDPDTGAVVMYGLAADGNKRSLSTVVNNTDGTMDIIERTNLPDGTSVTIGRTTVDYNTGSIISATTSTSTGRVQTPTTTTVQTFPDTQTQTGTGTGTGTTTIQFPTDYARQYEAQQSAQIVSTAIEQQTATLLENSPEPQAPPITEFDFFGDTFDELLTWQLPVHTGTCPTPTFEWQGIQTIDVHCDLIEDFRLNIDVAFVLLWSLISMAIVLRS